MTSWARTFLAVAMLTAAVHIAGCGGLKIASVWRDDDIVIDGIPTEWKGATTWVQSPNCAVGVKNDADYLYLSLSSPLEEIAVQMVMRGFTVWLDPEGDKGRTFGIHCPIGSPLGTGKPKELGEVARDQDRFQEMIVDRLKGAGSVFEVVGDGDENGTRLTAAEAAGIEVALGYQDGRVVYELKVPLRQDEQHPYAIGAKGKHRIGVGFETPEISRDEMMAGMREHRNGGMPGGGPYGGARPDGEMPGGDRDGGRGPRGGPRNMPQPLDVWVKVQLAG
jgi:hypothetical protein